MGQVNVAFVFVFIAQHYLHCGVFFPIVKFPQHLDVLAFSQAHKTTLDAAVEDGVFTSFFGFNCGLGSGVLHDGPTLVDVIHGVGECVVDDFPGYVESKL